MATYKAIRGVNIQHRDSDPTKVEGDVWYNASTSKLKVFATAGAWSTGNNQNVTANNRAGAKGGTQTAHLLFGGQSTNIEATAESYDGTTWSEVADLNTARLSLQGFGTLTASLASGGVTDASHLISTTAVEAWDESSWTETTEMNNARFAGGAFGTSTAGLIAAGLHRPGSPPGSPFTYRSFTETWNGSSWTETGNTNAAKYQVAGMGSTTSGLLAGGGSPPGVGPDNHEQWNGSTWTETTEMNTSRQAGTGSGPSGDDALFFTGGPSHTGKTEQWDGSSWTEIADLSTARTGLDTGAGTTSAAVCGGGGISGGKTNATEEFSFAAAVETVAVD